MLYWSINKLKLRWRPPCSFIGIGSISILAWNAHTRSLPRASRIALTSTNFQSMCSKIQSAWQASRSKLASPAMTSTAAIAAENALTYKKISRPLKEEETKRSLIKIKTWLQSKRTTPNRQKPAIKGANTTRIILNGKWTIRTYHQPLIGPASAPRYPFTSNAWEKKAKTDANEPHATSANNWELACSNKDHIWPSKLWPLRTTWRSCTLQWITS